MNCNSDYCEIRTGSTENTDLFLLIFQERTATSAQTVPMFVFDNYQDAFGYMAALDPPTNSTVISDVHNNEGRLIKYTVDGGNEVERAYYVQTIVHK